MLNLLEDYDFYRQLKEILSHLSVKSVIANDPLVGNEKVIITPGLIRAIVKFLCNLTTLSKEDTMCCLQENGLIKQLFRYKKCI